MPIGNIFDKLLYAVKFSEPNLVLSEPGPRELARSSTTATRAPMVEKVAPWLTVDSDPYPVVVDGRIKWVLDGYTVTDKYPLSQRESLETMTDDSLQSDTGFQTLPTDEINYMRNSVKATVDAYDGTVTLYEWDETDPILKAWDEVVPRRRQAASDEIPDELIEHLRYPEDLFKAQRYQFAALPRDRRRAWFDASTPLGGPERPARPRPPAAAVPSLRRRRHGELVADPRLRAAREAHNLVAFMAVNSDATSGRLRQDLGPRAPQRAHRRARADRQRVQLRRGRPRGAAAASPRAAPTPVPGNLLTLPVGDGLMYVQPVYTRSRHRVELPDPAVRAGVLRRRVGIGTTLREAIADVLGVSPTHRAPGRRPGAAARQRRATSATEPARAATAPGAIPTAGGSGSVNDQIRELLAEAEAKFARPPTRPRRTATRCGWARLMDAGPRAASTRPSRWRTRGTADPIWVRREPSRKVLFTDAGWSSSVARWAHNPEVAGSNPAPATNRKRPSQSDCEGLFCCATISARVLTARHARRAGRAGSLQVAPRQRADGPDGGDNPTTRSGVLTELRHQRAPVLCRCRSSTIET